MESKKTLKEVYAELPNEVKKVIQKTIEIESKNIYMKKNRKDVSDEIVTMIKNEVR